jgi:hypothetical protein
VIGVIGDKQARAGFRREVTVQVVAEKPDYLAG